MHGDTQALIHSGTSALMHDALLHAPAPLPSLSRTEETKTEMQPKAYKTTKSTSGQRPAASYQLPATSYRLIRRVLPIMLLLVVVLAGCAEGDPPPAAVCDTYDRGLYTAQLMGGALLILAVAILGFKKQVAAIIPTQGAQVGAIAGTVFGGLILLAFSTEIGVQILTGFGIPDLFTLCGL